MGDAINPAAVLAKIRSKIDAQQQVISLLEGELQNAILGGGTQQRQQLVGNSGTNVDTTIGGIYQEALGVAQADVYINAINAGLDEMGHVGLTDNVEQDALRQLLYQARALLGELRIEEQAWNGEINSEKTLRKEVNDFAKV